MSTMMSTKIAKMTSTNPQGAPAAEERVWGSIAAANNAKVPVEMMTKMLAMMLAKIV